MTLPPGTIIACGPVIIEDGKVLLNREQKPSGITPWLFPGGRMEDFAENFEDTCRREVREEMGIEVKILRPLKPMLVYRPDEPDKAAILIHFLATRMGEVTPGEGIVDWGWFDIHNLPSDVALNVRTVLADYLAESKLI